MNRIKNTLIRPLVLFVFILSSLAALAQAEAHLYFDGANDFLLIPELEESTSNHVRIFDRNGLKVFEKDNRFASIISTLKKSRAPPYFIS